MDILTTHMDPASTTLDYEMDYTTNSIFLSNKTVNNATYLINNYFDTPLTVIFSVMLTFSMLFATFGNLMVIIVILKDRRMREGHTHTNLFLCNLAIADLFVGIFMIPFSIITLNKERWIFPDWFCTFNSFINTTCFLTSIHTLMYIAVHKCICVSRMSYAFSKRKCFLMITAAWAWGLIFAVITTMGLGEALYKPKTMQCGPPYPEAELKTYILHVLNQTFNLFIPFGIMIIAYVKIFKINKESQEFRRKNSLRHEDDITRIKDGRVSCTLFIVLICFLLCWLPYLIYINFATLIKNKDDIPVYLNPMAYCFGYMNSACNPIIYAWRFPDFRKGYRDILCSCRNPSYSVSRGPDGRIIYRPREPSASNISNTRLSLASNMASDQRVSIGSNAISESRHSFISTISDHSKSLSVNDLGKGFNKTGTGNMPSQSRDDRISRKPEKNALSHELDVPLTRSTNGVMTVHPGSSTSERGDTSTHVEFNDSVFTDQVV